MQVQTCKGYCCASDIGERVLRFDILYYICMIRVNNIPNTLVRTKCFCERPIGIAWWSAAWWWRVSDVLFKLKFTGWFDHWWPRLWIDGWWIQIFIWWSCWFLEYHHISSRRRGDDSVTDIIWRGCERIPHAAVRVSVCARHIKSEMHGKGTCAAWMEK